MKKYFLLMCVLVISLSGCIKEIDNNNPDGSTGTGVDNGGSVTSQSTLDDIALQTYFKSNGITPLKSSFGLYYQITKTGTGANPTASSSVNINYTVKLLSTGVQVDSGSALQAKLNTLIGGMQLGLPLVNAGSSIILYVPSALAYGPAGTATIPANSVLIVTVDLLSFS